MNILDKLKAVLGMDEIKLGFMPAKPDAIIALFEYPATLPNHFFGGTDFVYNVQVRVRDKTAAVAYSRAEAIANMLNRYHDSEISVIQSTPILDIGCDSANPQRWEYTVNFEVRRY